jgi:hypothetical protein
MSFANRDSLTSSILISVPFTSSSCCIALAMNCKTMLNRSGESGHPCLLPDFRNTGFSISLLSMMLAIGLSCILFFFSFYFFYYSYVHTRLGSFLPPAPTPSHTTHSAPSLSPTPPQYPAETILPLFLILL